MLKNGIPYTATNSAIYTDAKLTLKAECSNKKLKDEKIICQIVTPKNDPPVTVTAAAHNTFDLVFKKVKQKTPVFLTFTVEGTKITETLKFSVLPEPEISAISHDPATVKVGKEVSFKLNPVLTYTPEKIGDTPAEQFVLPANRKVSYSADSTTRADVAGDGTVTTKEEGTCTVTMTAGGKTGSVVIKVDNRRGATAITSLTPSAAEVYFEHNATLTAVLEPADSWGNLEWTSDNEDVAVTVDPTDEKKATVSVAQGAKSGTVTITATAQGNKALTKEVTLTVHSVIPSKINITCSDSSDSMYVDEELTFTAKVFNEKGNEDSKLKQEIEWKAEPGYFFSITQDGKLTCKNTSILKGYDAQEVTVCAYSTADKTIYAKKEITVYKRPAAITAVSCKDEDGQPQTKCLTIENAQSSQSFLPRVYITTSGGSDSTTSNQFVISEKTEFTGKPTSDYLKTAVYKIKSSTPYCTLEPKKHTDYQPKTFYVYPIDPKTGTAITSGSKKSFSLTIYQYPKFDSISLDTKEYVFGVSEDPRLTIKLKDTDNFGISKKISITTEAYVKKYEFSHEEGHYSNILETTEYELAPNKASNHFALKFKPRNEWEEKIKKAHKIRIYIFLLDPHSSKPVVPNSIPSENFQHSINIHELDIKIEKGNFNIYEAGGTPSTYYESERLPYGSSKPFHFYVKVLPESIKPNLLEYDIKRIKGNYTCIVDHKKSDEQDKPGWIKYEFRTNGNNTWGSNDEADFVFKVKGVEIPRVLRIDSN